MPRSRRSSAPVPASGPHRARPVRSAGVRTAAVAGPVAPEAEKRTAAGSGAGLDGAVGAGQCGVGWGECWARDGGRRSGRPRPPPSSRRDAAIESVRVHPMTISLLRSSRSPGNFGSSEPDTLRRIRVHRWPGASGAYPAGPRYFPLVGLREAEVQADGGHLRGHVLGQWIGMPRSTPAWRRCWWDDGVSLRITWRSGSRRRVEGGAFQRRIEGLGDLTQRGSPGLAPRRPKRTVDGRRRQSIPPAGPRGDAQRGRDSPTLTATSSARELHGAAALAAAISPKR